MRDPQPGARPRPSARPSSSGRSASPPSRRSATRSSAGASSPAPPPSSTRSTSPPTSSSPGRGSSSGSAMKRLDLDSHTKRLIGLKDVTIAGALITGMANVAVFNRLKRDYPDGVPVRDTETTPDRQAREVPPLLQGHGPAPHDLRRQLAGARPVHRREHHPPRAQGPAPAARASLGLTPGRRAAGHARRPSPCARGGFRATVARRCPARAPRRPLAAPETGELLSDDLLDRFLAYVADKGLELYPAQEEAILELVAGKNVILATPTGSGKSLVAAFLHFVAVAEGKRSFYTAPIKALVNEKFFALSREFGPELVGMMTGDATRQPGRARSSAARPRSSPTWRSARARRRRRRLRGDGRVPLLRRQGARRGLADPAPHAAARAFLLMSATLGDTAFFERAARRSSPAAPTVTVRSTPPPRPARLRVPRDAAARDGARPRRARTGRRSTSSTSRSAPPPRRRRT